MAFLYIYKKKLVILSLFNIFSYFCLVKLINTRKMRITKRTKWSVIIALIVVTTAVTTIYKHVYTPVNQELLAADKSNGSESDSDMPKPKKVLNVNGLVIKPQLLVDEFNTTGLLLPDEQVELSFESNGKVVEINFQEGAYVEKGELLARINDSQLQAQLDRLTAQLKLANDRVYRQKTLLAKDAVSREALEVVETELAMLQADIDLVVAKIELTQLIAPFSGTIGLRQISVGQYVNGFTTVATLSKNAPLKVEFAIPERYSGHIGKGANISFKVEGELNSFNATVYAADANVDPELHQYTMRAIYPNKNGRLKAGRYALVELKKDEIADAITIPTVAIVPEMGRDKVYLYRSGVATPVEVITGIRTEGEVQVLQGLSVGDTIITSGTLQLRTGLALTLDNVQ